MGRKKIAKAAISPKLVVEAFATDPVVHAEVERVTRELHKEVRTRAPSARYRKKKYRLAKGTQWRMETYNKRPVGIVWVGDNTRHFAWFVNFLEFGTVKNAPRPFMRPALIAVAKRNGFKPYDYKAHKTGGVIW